MIKVVSEFSECAALVFRSGVGGQRGGGIAQRAFLSVRPRCYNDRDDPLI